MKNIRFIEEEEEFQRLMKEYSPFMQLTKSSSQAVHLYFEEATSGNIMPMLADLMKRSNDVTAYYFDLFDILGVEENLHSFRHHLGYYPIFEFSRNTGEHYTNTIYEDRPTPDGTFMLKLGYENLIIPPSKKWWIYTKAFDLEMSRLVSTVGVPAIGPPLGFYEKKTVEDDMRNGTTPFSEEYIAFEMSRTYNGTPIDLLPISSDL